MPMASSFSLLTFLLFSPQILLLGCGGDAAQDDSVSCAGLQQQSSMMPSEASGFLSALQTAGGNFSVHLPLTVSFMFLALHLHVKPFRRVTEQVLAFLDILALSLLYASG
jgi:hypothetical protein